MRRRKPTGVRGLGDLEVEVMKRLWARSGPTSVREVHDDLRQDRVIAYTTVMTVLDNLHGKGWVERQLDGRAYRYQPTSSGEEYSAELMRRALSTSHDRVGTFAHFLQGMSDAEVSALEEAYRQFVDNPPGDEGRRA
jgi:predicted transcriptional regulator